MKKKHYCIEKDCNNEICYSNWLYGSKKCGHCSHVGKKNHKHSLRMCGKNNPNFKHNISKDFLVEKYSKKEKTVEQVAHIIKCSKNTIRRNLKKYGISLDILRKRPNVSGKKSNFYGKTLRPKWGKYKNINMRSNWEIWFAQFLDLSGYKWQYEPKRFNLGDSTYTPDFYLPEFDCYIEIKGWFPIEIKNKIDKFKHLYSRIKLQILMKKDLKKLGVI